MKYLLMIYGNQEKWNSLPAEQWPEVIARQEAFNARYRETGELLGAYGLADAEAATLVRRGKDGAPAVTDGPYLETKEYMASFYLLDCENEERARRIAADMPLADTDPVELWPILHESPANGAGLADA
ncbi:YciI family protein [Streptomyces nanhaiensis]|uniref:YciI family protein n=1 Tax=Streptomyces nanhaiensis TaxID=679319 RepID=UPI00399D27E2